MAQFNPQPFGKYYLVDKLAVGGMAEIFLAKPPSGATTGPRYLVIKRILPHYSTNSQFIDMFIDEAKISVQLEHENIVPVFDLGKVGETYFLAMQFVAGQDLKAVVTRCRDRGVRLSYEHAAYLVGDLLKGLDYAHKKTDRSGKPLHIVHRDISPQNVLVGYDGSVKITDFGIAKAESKLDSTQVGTLKGKFGYMAPEQVVAGGPTLDHRSDIFATGIILWELVTGHRLFAGTSEIEILERVRAAKFDPPSAFVPDIPRELERIIFRALMKDREKRYSSAYEMSVDLGRFLESYAPQFNQAEMSAVMEELFTPEIALAKSRWNVVIGPVIDKTKVDRGAAQESTRPDQTRVSDSPLDERARSGDEGRPIGRPEAIEPQRTRVATPVPAGVTQVAAPRTPTPSQPQAAAKRGVTPPPTRAPALTWTPVAEPRNLETRTQLNAPAQATGPKVLTPEDLFDDPGSSPFGDGEERTTTNEVRIDREAQAKQPITAPRTPSRSPARAPVPDFEQSERTTTNDTAALKRGKSGVAPVPPEKRSAVRPWLVFSLLGVLLATGGMLAFMGVIPNPFAPPMIEVASTVDVLISIDGNVVLASGRNGSWRVGEGIRRIEVKRAGYTPILKTINISRGQHVFVDATMVPLPDAVSDIDVTSTPPGAHVYLDAEEQDGVTPLTIHPKIGDHTLRVALDGYLEDVRALRAGKPGREKAAEFLLVPSTAAIHVETTPAGADVFVDGQNKGRSPLTIESLPAGKSYVVTTSLKGFEPETRTIALPGGTEPLGVTIALVATGGPTSTPAAADTASPAATPVVAIPAATSAVTPAPVEDKTKGYLTVDVPGGWGEVWVDGTQLSRKSPLEKTAIAAGTHTLRVFNPVLQQEKIIEINITAGKINSQRVPLDQ